MVLLGSEQSRFPFVQKLRLGEAQKAQLIKWHEGHVKQLQSMAAEQVPVVLEVTFVDTSLHYWLCTTAAFTPLFQALSPYRPASLP